MEHDHEYLHEHHIAHLHTPQDVHTPEQAQEACAHIRGVVADFAGADAASKMRILYGGSMNTGNAELFLPQSDIDGGLIGGASLDAKAFSTLVEMALKAK